MSFQKEGNQILMRSQVQDNDYALVEPFFSKDEFSVFIRDILQLQIKEIQMFYDVIGLKLPHLCMVPDMVSLSEFIKAFPAV